MPRENFYFPQLNQRTFKRKLIYKGEFATFCHLLALGIDQLSRRLKESQKTLFVLTTQELESYCFFHHKKTDLSIVNYRTSMHDTWHILPLFTAPSLFREKRYLLQLRKHFTPI